PQVYIGHPPEVCAERRIDVDGRNSAPGPPEINQNDRDRGGQVVIGNPLIVACEDRDLAAQMQYYKRHNPCPPGQSRRTGQLSLSIHQQESFSILLQPEPIALNLQTVKGCDNLAKHFVKPQSFAQSCIPPMANSCIRGSGRHTRCLYDSLQARIYSRPRTLTDRLLSCACKTCSTHQKSHQWLYAERTSERYCRGRPSLLLFLGFHFLSQ